MRKFRLFGFGIVCFLAFGASPALAQAKLVYVQGQLVLEKSAEGKKIMAQLRESDQKNKLSSPGWTRTSASSRPSSRPRD